MVPDVRDDNVYAVEVVVLHLFLELPKEICLGGAVGDESKRHCGIKIMQKTVKRCLKRRLEKCRMLEVDNIETLSMTVYEN
jgi:hypothetical protein